MGDLLDKFFILTTIQKLIDTGNIGDFIEYGREEAKKEGMDTENLMHFFDELENEFCDNIEMFHYSVKGNKTPLFTKNEFCDFYSLISFIIDSDSDFIAMINTEWKKVINEPNQNEKYIEPSNNKFTELNNQTRKFSPI